jgi:general secretion pathway protein N
MKISLDSSRPKLPKIFWILLCAIVLLVLIKQLPASVLTNIVAKQSACRVTLHEAIGTVWNGSAALGFSESSLNGEGCRDPSAISERFSWQTQCSVMQGQCLSQFHFVGLDKPLIISLRLGQIQVASGEMTMPASILEAFGPPWNTLRPRGQLVAHWSDLKSGTETAGNIRINISNLSSPISAVKPLGSYEIKTSLSQSGTSFVIDTVTGPLLLSGKGEANKGVRFAGGASAAPEAEESLIGLLSLLGRKDGDIYRMQY